MAENFQNLKKETDKQVQEAQRVPNKVNTNRPTPRHIIIKKAERRRWRKSKMQRSPSSPQIHQKYIYTWNCSYRIPTERWQKTSDLQKGKKLPRTWVGQKKKEKTKTKNRDGACTSGREL